MFHRDKIGEEFLLAFDESQAMLALISCEKVCNPGDSNVEVDIEDPLATVARLRS